MSKISLALGGVVAASGLLTSSLVVRAQGPTRFEYARVTRYIERMTTESRNSVVSTVQERVGYRACVAGGTGWACHEFKPTTDTSTDALRVAFVYLGNEGWELVSAAPEASDANAVALTYLFKRQMR